ncbi:MAG: extracellular solute-binding protein [Candidatus Magasanikbacteria bacterium]
MSNTRKIIMAVVGATVLVVLLVVLGFFFGRPSQSPKSRKAKLDFWVVGEQKSSFKTAISSFKSEYPNVEINLRVFDSVENYENTLLKAMATNEGPDIFSIRNNDLYRKKDKIEPLNNRDYSLVDLKEDFPQIVEKSFVRDGRIYALPLYIDTLSLIYNKNIFNEKGIVFPPKKWKKFKKIAKELTKKGPQGKIERAGTAFGRADNIKNFKDILSLLLFQKGAQLMSENYSSADLSGQQSNQAFQFYTQFGKPKSNYYMWPESMPNSRKAFSQKKAAMIIDYSSAVRSIRQKSPFLEVGVAKVPQFSSQRNEISLGHFWGYTVSTKTNYPTIAWDFILHLTTDPSVANSYIKKTEKPPALKRLIKYYKTKPKFETFASQALTATSWTEPNPDKIKNIFADTIEAIIEKEESVGTALDKAAQSINNLVK